MKKEIPQFLIEMSKQLNEQNNRMTADPLFEVRYKKYLVTEEGYNESHFEIIDDDCNTLHHSGNDSDYSALAEYLYENEKEWCDSWLEDNCSIDDLDSDYIDQFTLGEFTELFCDNYQYDGWIDLPDELKIIHLQEVEETVNSHFTEADAQAFIDRKQHDYPKLYIYAISLCYCENMAKLRNWIKGLND